MELGSGKKVSKKDNDALDDLLGDLLTDDSPTKKKTSFNQSPVRQRPGGNRRGVQSGVRDDQFYSSLANLADSDASDVSEADVGKMAVNLGGLDDMDADLFGGNLKRKNSPGRSSGKPTTPRATTPRSKNGSQKSPKRGQSPSRSPSRGDSTTTPPGSARSSSLKRKPVKPPSPATAASTPSPVTQPLDPKPGSAPGKLSDLSKASEALRPGQSIAQRPDTAPKIKSKYDFGDFDPDDPLAGVLSDDDFDISEGDRPRSGTKKSSFSTPVVDKMDAPEKNVTIESPRRRSLMDRPPTRSGSNVGGGDIAGDVGEASSAKKPAAKSQNSLFSEDDSDLLDGLGLEGGKTETAPARKAEVVHKPPKADVEDLQPARSVFDSLLGRGPKSSTSTILDQPKGRKEFVLDSKYSSSAAGSVDGKEEEDFNFGNYQPSAASGSRPNSRRSVRFQDDDDIFGLDHQSPRAKSPGNKGRSAPATNTTSAPADMSWLEMASGGKPSPTSPSVPSAATGKPPTPPSKSDQHHQPPSTASTIRPDSPKKTTASTPAAPTKTPSPRAWLGLGDSDSDEDDFFKPRKSASRSAALPQTPAAAANTSPSPRIPPKKAGKKDNTAATAGTAPADYQAPAIPAVSAGVEEDEDDDWLARAKSRRQQQMMKKDDNAMDAAGISTRAPGMEQSPYIGGGGGGGVNAGGVGGMMEGTGEFDPNSLRVDLSSLAMDSPLVSRRSVMASGGKSELPFSHGVHQSGAVATDSPRTALSKVVNQNNLAGPGTFASPHSSHMPTPASDARLKMVHSPSPHGRTSDQSSHHQQQYTQIQEETKTQLLQQQQQLQHMMGNIQNQYNAINTVQMPSATSNIPSYNQMNASLDLLPESLPEAQAKLRKVELEKGYMESLLDNTKRRFEEEMLAVETSYKNRLQILDESNRKREARLREENEELMQQHVSRVRQLEQDKGDLIAANFRKLEDWEMSKAQEMERMKEKHRVSTSGLKREHEEAMERLAQTKNQEINMVANANNTSKSLTAVVEQIQNNARDLGELQMKVDTWNRQGLDEREISLKSKDEQLRMLQERLNRQEEDNDRERKRLEELISRMETQLRGQTRTMEEERWKLKQDQSRVEAQQRAIEEERRMWMEQQTRERVTLDRSRESFLDEQRNAMAQVSEERRSLAEDRTKFSLEQKTVREKVHHDAIKHTQAEADYDMLVRTISEEKSQHSSRRQELQREEGRMEEDRRQVEKLKANLDQEREKLADQARQIRQQSSQIDHMTESANHTQQEGEKALEQAMQMSAMIEQREQDVYKQQNGLKVMEERISQEKLRLAKEKKEVENLKSASLCTNCRGPLHGGGGVNAPVMNGFHPAHSTPANMGGGVPPSPIPPPHLSHSLHQPHHHRIPAPSNNPLDAIAESIANDRAVRLWKIQAIKDKEFLDEESVYLEGLRYTPYHSTVSSKS